MSKKFDVSMFDKIKDSFQTKSSTSGGSFANVLKMPKGHTYTLRLIPNLEDPEKTCFAHYIHSWESRSTGKFVSALSLQTFGQNDPIANVRWKMYKEWKDSNPPKDAKFEGPIDQKQQWFVNVYVIDDPNNPDNNGTVKVLRMGPQLKDKIDAATEGARKDELGWEIFDLSSGHDFKIQADEQGIYTTYKESWFTTKSKTVLTDEQIEEIYANVHDLEQILTVKTEEELLALLDEHFFCDSEKVDDDKSEKRLPLAKAKAVDKPAAKKETTKKVKDEPKIEDVDDDIPFEFASDNLDTGDIDIDDLIAGLDED